MQCGLVEPVWTRIGSVKWQGIAAPEPLFMAERQRCQCEAHGYTRHGGLRMWWCSMHAAEMSRARGGDVA